MDGGSSAPYESVEPARADGRRDDEVAAFVAAGERRCEAASAQRPPWHRFAEDDALPGRAGLRVLREPRRGVRRRRRRRLRRVGDAAEADGRGPVEARRELEERRVLVRAVRLGEVPRAARRPVRRAAKEDRPASSSRRDLCRSWRRSSAAAGRAAARAAPRSAAARWRLGGGAEGRGAAIAARVVALARPSGTDARKRPLRSKTTAI